MTRASRILGSVAVLAAIEVTLLTRSVAHYHDSSPFARERRAREALLAPLVQSHASRAQTLDALRLPFEDVSASSTNAWIRSQLASVPRLREAAGRYPVVSLHTGTLTLVWLFFDSDQALRDAVVTEQ